MSWKELAGKGGPVAVECVRLGHDRSRSYGASRDRPCYGTEVVRALICCLAEGALLGTDHSRSSHVPVMQRFEEFLEANRGKPLYVAEICSAIGISDRTLRLHCTERLGMNPQRYLWLRRMHQARRLLAVANAANKTVTEIAMDHGFWELGRFSVACRNSSVSHLWRRRCCRRANGGATGGHRSRQRPLRATSSATTSSPPLWQRERTGMLCPDCSRPPRPAR